MTRNKRTLLLVATHTMAVALGAVGAYVLVARDGVRGMQALADLSVASLQETHVNLQRDTGSDEEYEAALRQYVSVMDRLTAASQNPEDRSSLRISRMAALGRLALMAERRGAAEEAKEFMKLAATECGEASRPQCSEEKLRELAAYFDKGRASRPR